MSFYDRSDEREALHANLSELFRLYVWRFELAALEKSGADVRAALRVYGQQKKSAWQTAARLLGQPMPKDGV